MTDVHRRFLQLLMTHGVLEERGVRRLQKHCYRVHGREYRLPVPRVPGTAPSAAGDTGVSLATRQAARLTWACRSPRARVSPFLTSSLTFFFFFFL